MLTSTPPLRIPRSSLYLTALSLLFAANLAAESSDWTSVTGLAAGTRVEVIHGALKRSSGTLVAANDREVILRTDAGDATLARADVARVSVPRKSKTKRIVTAIAIGAAAGAAAMAIGAEAGDIDIRRDIVIGAGLAIGAAGGAAVGAVMSGPVTVYRAP